MEYAKDSYLYNLFAILLRTGLRNGEIRALKYSDIDRKNNVRHIRHTMKTITGFGMVEDTPKTKIIYQRHSINAGYDQIHRSAKTLLGI